MDVPITIGKLRHRVQLQELTAGTPDGHGHVAPEWTEIDELWAAVEPKGASETIRADRLAADTTHAVTLRFREGVKPDQQILFGTRELNITKVWNVEERDVVLVLECIEQVN